MLWVNAFLLVIIFSVQHLHECVDEDIQFSHRVVSGKKGDLFAVSLSTSFHRLVVGAPWDNDKKGSMMVEDGLKIGAPQGKEFGWQVDVNQQFIVVSGQSPESVYVFTSTDPYYLKATLPVDIGFSVEDVIVAEDKTIVVVATGVETGFLTI